MRRYLEISIISHVTSNTLHIVHLRRLQDVIIKILWQDSVPRSQLACAVDDAQMSHTVAIERLEEAKLLQELLSQAEANILLAREEGADLRLSLARAELAAEAAAARAAEGEAAALQAKDDARCLEEQLQASQREMHSLRKEMEVKTRIAGPWAIKGDSIVHQ